PSDRGSFWARRRREDEQARPSETSVKPRAYMASRLTGPPGATSVAVKSANVSRAGSAPGGGRELACRNGITQLAGMQKAMAKRERGMTESQRLDFGESMAAAPGGNSSECK